MALAMLRASHPAGQSLSTDIGVGSGLRLAGSGLNLCIDIIDRVVYWLLPYFPASQYGTMANSHGEQIPSSWPVGGLDPE